MLRSNAIAGDFNSIFPTIQVYKSLIAVTQSNATNANVLGVALKNRKIAAIIRVPNQFSALYCNKLQSFFLTKTPVITISAAAAALY